MILLIMATYLNNSHFEIFHKNGVRHLNLAVKLHSLGGAMKNFRCDILRNNVEIGWYRANAGPIQAGQCWADTIGPMLGRYKRANAGPIQSGQCWADSGKYIDFYHGVSSVLAQYRLYRCRYKRYSPV